MMDKSEANLHEPCVGCSRTGVNLFLCDDVGIATIGDGVNSSDKSRYCSSCMIGKKVRVFWPVDSQWYVGVVQEFDETTGEHLLCYPDGDTEWVKIGESGTGPSVATAMNNHSTKSTINAPTNAASSPNKGLTRPDYTHPGHPSNASSRHPNLSINTAEADYHHPPYPPHGHHYNVSPHFPPLYNTSPSSAYHPSSQHPYFNPHHPHQNERDPNLIRHPHPHHHMDSAPVHSQYSRYPVGAEPMLQPMPQSSPPSTLAGGNMKRKSGPKTWTKEEDAQLLSMVASMRMPMKWSLVAQSMPDRTGKQCRERYVNHLNPRLKITDWSPAEDAVIFHLYNTCSSQWAKMSKMIPGRTDNGIKNRFHNLRRQLEREDEHRIRLSKPSDFPDEIHLDRIRTYPDNLKGKCDELWDMSNGIAVLAAQSVLGGNFARNAGRFGPFRAADLSGEQCARCGLFAPSSQCGYEICTKTKWCQTCTRIPPHMCSNLLRECLNLRKPQQENSGGFLEEEKNDDSQTDTAMKEDDEEGDNQDIHEKSTIESNQKDNVEEV